MTDHVCIHEADIATLEERTLHFNNTVADIKNTQKEQTAEIKTLTNTLNDYLSAVKAENNFKDKMAKVALTIGGGLVGSGGTFGIFKALGITFK